MAEHDDSDGTNDELTGAERGIPEVATSTRQNNWPVGGFGITIVALLLWFINKPDGDSQPQLTDPTPQEFSVPTRFDPPNMPEPSATDTAAIATASARIDPYQREFEVELQRRALREAEAAQKLAEQRRRSPILVFDQKTAAASPSIASPAFAGAVPAEAQASDPTVTPSEAFAARIGDERTATASALFVQNPSTLLAQGSLIRGVLETAIQSDLPGLTRAEVSHDVYSFDGSRLLIPKGSRLIGKYQSGLLRGQTRVFVIWTRLLRPDGASIQIGSPGTDLLGRAGLAGEVDRHFFEIFGASILLSLIDGGIQVAAASVSNTNTSTTINQGGNDISRAAEIALRDSINIPPTIHIDQGSPIQVFVAKDLDFINVERIRH